MSGTILETEGKIPLYNLGINEMIQTISEGGEIDHEGIGNILNLYNLLVVNNEHLQLIILDEYNNFGIITSALSKVNNSVFDSGDKIIIEYIESENGKRVFKSFYHASVNNVTKVEEGLKQIKKDLTTLYNN